MKRRYAMMSFLVGAAAARAGDEMSGPALLLAGYAVGGSATEASALLAGITVSAAVGGTLLGVLLDRSPRPGRLLARALALYGTGLVAILLSLGRLPFELTVLIAVFTGLLGPALSGGWTAQLPRVVPRERLPRANALDAMTFSLASLAGPALAGALAHLLGAPAAVVASAALIAFALPAAWTLPTGRDRGRDRDCDPVPVPVRDRNWDNAPPTASASMTADLAAGIRCITRTRPLARTTLASVVSCMGLGMLITCTPPLGERTFGSAADGTLLLSCTAVSALAANAVLARRPRAIAPDTIIWGSTLILAVALVLSATGHPVLVVAAALTAGVGEGPQLAALLAIRHRESPERLRSQVFTTGASLKITGFALGAAVAGPLATHSLPTALLTAAGVQLVAGLSFHAHAAGRTMP
ncbi:MFS transporter [Streptomyces sp. IB201691-2A2]|uniref:MFS transporter n=1 Tax=Streptomyces sp. IB201691-2A2 TaxID=2561920 RepID=UPI00117E78F4|nr:MFS transporter [Streptomyces sp. IB201691-2A2]TRO69480.1 MFS transporter [Streptomyces sp. IB201691-2A2]